ncbi:GldL-related protein [Hymenobacter glacieicola]|uniref:Gliding motility protein GldL-like N-terminal domain-containing protein n=1 Tax=Hymenobacter glacieicola TaxID=1562124 RepID=A0ABQ1X3Q6_9BACT|nr:hypothetical protein GCM10011378_33550 [Hymenobacter glacieicola]
MKTKHFLLLFCLGLSANVVGAMFKILHWQGADVLLITGALPVLTGAVGFIYKLFSHPKVKDFLNR